MTRGERLSRDPSMNLNSIPLMLWSILVILLIFWALGFSLHVAGGLIHLLLVIALIVLVIQLLTGRRV